MAECTVSELAQRVGGEMVGDGDRVIRGVATLESAGPDQLSLVANKKYISYVPATRAAAILISRDLAKSVDSRTPQIRVRDAHAALREVLLLFHPPARPAGGVHPTAVVEEDVELGPEVSVGPYAVIGAGSRLGARVTVGAHSVIGS
jgi:UDP-3-O-[3-hydroxymyristoyl] glucosamine N-acyltransferase